MRPKTLLFGLLCGLAVAASSAAGEFDELQARLDDRLGKLIEARASASISQRLEQQFEALEALQSEAFGYSAHPPAKLESATDRPRSSPPSSAPHSSKALRASHMDCMASTRYSVDCTVILRRPAARR